MKVLQCPISKKPITNGDKVVFSLMEKFDHTNESSYRHKTIFFVGEYVDDYQIKITDDDSLHIFNKIKKNLGFDFTLMLKYSFNYDHKNIYYNKSLLRTLFIKELSEHKNRLSEELLFSMGFKKVMVNLNPKIGRKNQLYNIVEKTYVQEFDGKLCELKISFEKDKEELVMEISSFNKIINIEVNFDNKSFVYNSIDEGLKKLKLEDFLLRLSNLIGVYVGLKDKSNNDTIRKLLNYKFVVLHKDVFDNLVGYKYEHFFDTISDKKVEYETILKNSLIEYDDCYSMYVNTEVGYYKDIVKLVSFIHFIKKIGLDIKPNKFIKEETNDDYLEHYYLSLF